MGVCTALARTHSRNNKKNCQKDSVSCGEIQILDGEFQATVTVGCQQLGGISFDLCLRLSASACVYLLD